MGSKHCLSITCRLSSSKMGQINSLHDSDTTQVVQTANKPDNAESDEKSKKAIEQQREANSEQVRCVKTRIDMLIEDCLSTNDISADIENERNRHSEISNFISNQKNEIEKKKDVMNESKDNPVIGCKKNKKLDITGHSERPDSQRHDKTGNANSVVSIEKHDAVPEKKAAKPELKVSDIITDMVNTELTQNQLIQIQQRTLTTFNTFIDKVLDSSLIKDNNDEDKPKQTNILQLCSESMLPESKRKLEDIVDERNEKPECDRDTDKDKTEKKVTLKDHIERFLELSFRDENLKEEIKMKEKKTNSPENFNARGLVNSMITQGLEINHVITAKEQHTGSNLRNYSPKESELQVKQVKVPAQNLRPPNREIYEQRSPSSNSFQDRAEDRNSHALASQPTADAKFRDHYINATKYELCHRNSQMPLGYTRRDANLDRNHEIPTKLHVNVNTKHEKGIMNNMRTSDHSSAFHQPQNLLVVNNAYYQPDYVPRMLLSPGQIRDMKSPVSRDGKQIIHVRDCTCSMCVQQSHSRQSMVEAPTVEHLAGNHSPNVPREILAHNVTVQTASGPLRNGITSGDLREVPAMMRPSHSELPPGLVAYQGMHKLVPHHPPITSSKVYAGDQLLVPDEISPQSFVAGRRLGLQESQQHLHYHYHHRGEELQQNPAGNERSAIHSGKPSPYLVRPSSVPSQYQNNSLYSRPSSGHRSFESDYTRNTDSLSGSSECSNEAPLDLTVKKPKIEPMRSRAISNASTVRKINPSNTFIKHLESSVDKYWQEINSPPSSPASIKPPTPVNRSVTPNDGKCSTYRYPQQSPTESSPPALLNMLHRGSLPSPHYSGGITLGHPLMDIKPPVSQKQTEYQYSNIPQTGPPVANHQAHSPSQFQGIQPIFDMASKRSAANISKHEPIQNIIGQNDPNDILYLICRLCTQTYGSPYGFRKHFRNQHGFEPRAEHTIVQTISATKSALQLPQPQVMQGMSEICESHIIRKSVSPPECEIVCQKRAACIQLRHTSSSVSPTDSKSIAGSDEGEKSELENSETKFLECPECGKTFQLNDFGSYKRHCRQHGNVRMNGPFACSDCHLPFPDQKSLREHYIVHVKDTPVAVKQEQKNEGSIHKSESHHTCYACVKCDQQFDNMDTYKCHLTSHNLESKTHCKVSPETGKCKQTVSVEAEDETSVDIGMNNVVKQEAESNTLIACPDSSWDNVVKVVATSNKMELNSETSESNCSIMSNVSDKGTNKEETNSENSLTIKITTQESVEIESDCENKTAENEFIYKHKKFFLHRKRANSNQSQSADVSDPKQRKRSESPTTVTDNVPMSSLPTVVVNTLCDSTRSPEVVESVRSKEVPFGKSLKSTSEKTEARHSLPFVWDRTTRSQKKS